MTRLARALNSDDLKHEDRPCDVDVLQAAGLTAIKRGLGMLVLEAKEAQSVARIKALEASFCGVVHKWARRWKVRVEAASVAAFMVRELVLDRCLVCQGRGFIPMKYDGQRMVAVIEDEGPTKDVDCSVCLGSGAARRDYHGRAKAAGWKEYDKRLGEWWEAMLGHFADAELGARQEMYRRLKR